MAQKPSRRKVKITIVKRLDPSEIFKKIPVETVGPIKACDRWADGQDFIVGEDGRIPTREFCNNAWDVLWGRVRALAFGADYPWFKEKGVDVVCCVDGLRPVIFKLERLDQ